MGENIKRAIFGLEALRSPHRSFVFSVGLYQCFPKWGKYFVLSRVTSFYVHSLLWTWKDINLFKTELPFSERMECVLSRSSWWVRDPLSCWSRSNEFQNIIIYFPQNDYGTIPWTGIYLWIERAEKQFGYSLKYSMAECYVILHFYT